MGKKNKQAVSTEFPLLEELGLYASATKGDGNCLFRALSDQVFGDESHHAEIRNNVVSYVEQHGEHFAAFVGEFGETFEQYVQRLYQDGVYGGHIEIVGFSEYYARQVAIYQADNMYVLEPQSIKPSEWDGVAHVAYHTWEHYSSVRPKAGPHSGPVKFPVPAVSDSEGGSSKPKESQGSAVPPWKIEIVLRSVPDVPEARIKELLETKELDTVIEELLMQGFDEPEAAVETADTNDAEKTMQETQTGISEKEAAATPKTTRREKKEKQTNGETSVNKKQLAKERRHEKKERARKRKTGAGAAGQASDDKKGVEDSSGVTKKVIHI